MCLACLTLSLAGSPVQPMGAMSFGVQGLSSHLSVLSNPELALSQGLPAHPGLPPDTEILPVVPYCYQKKRQCLNHF